MPTFQLLSLTTQGECNRTSMRRIEAQHAICAGGGAPSSPATHRAADHRINNKWHASLNRCLEQLHSRYRRPFPDQIASKRRRIRVSVIDDSIGEREA